MRAALTIVILIVFALLGLCVWTSSARPLALREIAINTRQDRSRGTDYAYLRVLSVVIKILGALVWNIGVALAIVVNLVDFPGLL